jgi:radical SAM superfamily enzyme YgiQ (UPF0313 family)
MVNPKFTLLYPRLQFRSQDVVKPDGSLALPYLAGALRRAGYEVSIFDASVGGSEDDLQKTFYTSTKLPTGLMQIGVTDDRLLEVVADADVVGITSIFTMQTTMVLDMIRKIKTKYPDKIVITGGVNARYAIDSFLDAGCDLVFTSEADEDIVALADALKQNGDWRSIPGTVGRVDGKRHVTPAKVIKDLDTLAMPAWDLLPNSRYWEISRPHGGDFKPGERIQYASMMTSRGCPFSCSYCHISKEKAEDISGNIGAIRFKSVDRVIHEAKMLKDLGVTHLFIEDDSLIAKKKRASQIFKRIHDMKLDLIDVNGVNIVHLMKNDGCGGLTTDLNFLDDMAAAGFTKITLPFESANQRVLDKWASGKWQTNKIDTVNLIQACHNRGITSLGNYTIGYPDETFDEVMETVMMAKQHVDAGLGAASFFIIVPFPGSALYDYGISNGILDPYTHPDEMNWTRSVFKNIPVSADVLEAVRTMAWKLINKQNFVQERISMSIKGLS